MHSFLFTKKGPHYSFWSFFWSCTFRGPLHVMIVNYKNFCKVTLHECFLLHWNQWVYYFRSKVFYIFDYSKVTSSNSSKLSCGCFKYKADNFQVLAGIWQFVTSCSLTLTQSLLINSFKCICTECSNECMKYRGVLHMLLCFCMSNGQQVRK